MLVVGVIASLMLGMTATSMSMRRDRELIRDQSSFVESGMRRGTDHSWDSSSAVVEIPGQPPVPAPAPRGDSQTRLQKLIDQGYSAEVAQVILENEDN